MPAGIWKLTFCHTVQQEKETFHIQNQLIFGEHKNVFLTDDEKSELLENCTETILNQEMDSYSVWKKENNAKPKSDFETLRKWLNQKRQKGAYKANITAVKKTGIDEVSQETLDNLPF